MGVPYIYPAMSGAEIGDGDESGDSGRGRGFGAGIGDEEQRIMRIRLCFMLTGK